MPLSQTIKKVWNFIWHDDSIWSWLVNIVLAFVIVKFIIYPGLGFLLSTSFPVVAVVSSSMHHSDYNFDSWWEKNSDWYLKNNITKEQFETFRFKHGFNKGDIMVIYGVKSEDVKLGDVIVYNSNLHTNPIIHRVVKVDSSFITKGDNNNIQDPSPVTPAQIENTGKAVFRIPLLGWIKIIATMPFQGGVPK